MFDKFLEHLPLRSSTDLDEMRRRTRSGSDCFHVALLVWVVECGRYDKLKCVDIC